jgi:hypothetical protein
MVMCQEFLFESFDSLTVMRYMASSQFLEGLQKNYMKFWDKFDIEYTIRLAPSSNKVNIFNVYSYKSTV